MRTKNRLNWSFAGGSVVIAAFTGTICSSGTVFWVSLLVLLALNVANDEIRP